MGIVAAVVAATGLLALASAPAGAGDPAEAGTVTTPFEPPTAVPRFETFPWHWAGNPAVITVDNKLKKLRDPIKKALSVWNHAGIDIKWKFKSGGADVKVVKYGNAPCGFGLATTNYEFNGKATDAPAWPTQCDPQTDQWYCRVLAEDDLKGAKSIYGANPKVKDPQFCPVSEPLR